MAHYYIHKFRRTLHRALVLLHIAWQVCRALLFPLPLGEGVGGEGEKTAIYNQE